MRMNSIPRSIADRIDKQFKQKTGKIDRESPPKAAEWLETLSDKEWDKAIPSSTKMTGQDYKQIWNKLNGIE